MGCILSTDYLYPSFVYCKLYSHTELCLVCVHVYIYGVDEA